MTPTVRLGCLGDAVMTLQAALNLWTGSQQSRLFVDGFFGLCTNSKVREYQAAHDLAPDGVVGPLTWEALRPLVERVAPTPEAVAQAASAPAAPRSPAAATVAATRIRPASARAWTATYSARRDAMPRRASRS